MPELTVAFDDIDSRVGGCTTHLTALFLVELHRMNATLLDYPLLVRLNPSIPWKTRGNASTAVRIRYDGDPRDVWDLATWLVDEYAGARPWMQGKKPGVVMALGRPWRDPGFRLLYRSALTSLVPKDMAVSVLERYGASYTGGSGIIGAAAALGALDPVSDDYTFELLAYRSLDRWHEDRCIRSLPPAMVPACVFNNYMLGEGFTGAPGGGDPVLAGIRGDCPSMLWSYLEAVVCEDPDIVVLYRSNQHTDPHHHVNPPVNIYSYGFYKVQVTSIPHRLPGGHVIVEAKVQGHPVDLAFYRETGPLRDSSLHLLPGDTIKISGQVKPGVTSRPIIAVDKMIIDEIKPYTVYASPRCPKCGYRMKSMGRSKGYRCPRCGYMDRNATKVRIVMERGIMPGVYTPAEGRLPHLVSPSFRKRNRPLSLGPGVTWDTVLTPL